MATEKRRKAGSQNATPVARHVFPKDGTRATLNTRHLCPLRTHKEPEQQGIYHPNTV